MFNLNFFKKSSSIVFAIASLFVTISAGFMAVDYSKLASAAPVYACSSSETLSGTNCLTPRTATPKFELKCKTGYTMMDTSCTKFVPVACSSYLKGVDAENGFCKFSTTNIYGGEILNYDGRECNGNGYSFYRYNVGLDFRDTNGPIVCANTYSETAGVSAYRWMQKNITEITNMESIQTDSVISPCPALYTVLSETQCSRPAVVKSCDAGGEYSAGTTSVSCTPCPAGSYCPVTPAGSTTTTVCPNGGVIVGNHCQADLQYSVTSYNVGCDTGYIKLDQTCAIVQYRDHDLGCSYFYSSNNVFAVAVDAGNGMCSTGGRTDFDSTNIFKVSDLNCAGPGTGWYNYNVNYDPLVCGNTYDSENKAAFRWYPATYTKITGLQKLPYQNKVCPAGWVAKVSGNNFCYQEPVILIFTTPLPCGANTYSGSSAISCTNCPAGYTSPAQSASVNACSPIPCTNGAINPPTCNVCPSSKVFVNQTCISPCTNGAINPPSCNTCPNDKVLYNGSCLNPCTNGATNPTTCNTCPEPKVLSSGICVNPCTNGAINPSACDICVSPKVIINGHCDIPVVSSSSVASSSPAPVCKATVVGKVYLDTNNNGFQDANEPDGNIPAGVTIAGSYVGEEGNVAPTLFNSAGVYEFTNVTCNKSFTVTVLNTSSNSISNSVENGEGTGSNPTTVVIGNVFNKEYNAGKDGLYKAPVIVSSSATPSSVASSSPTPVCKASVFGKIYVDSNNNGIQDTNEPDGNIPSGVTVTGKFIDSNSTIVSSLDSNGNYTFDNLDCNKTLVVTVNDSNPLYTISNSQENGEGNGSNPTTVIIGNVFNKSYNAGKDGVYKTPIVVSSSSVVSSSPTPAPICRIVGKVYLDPNKNGLQDSNEPNGSLPNGINVVLAKDGNPILTASPDSNGNYSFENIPCNAGVHTVTVVAPVGYTISNSLETADGTGSNPTTININSTIPKTFDVGKDGIYLNTVICFNGFVNDNNICICPSSKVLINGNCLPPCTNGAVNPSFCTICRFGKILINNICLVPASSSSVTSSSVNSSSVVSSSVVSSSVSSSSVSSSSSSSSVTPTIINNYYTYNNPTNTNTFNPVNTFTPSVVNTPNNSVVVSTPAPTIYSAPAPVVVYTSTEKVVNTSTPVKTVYTSEFATVRTGGMNYIVAFLVAIAALIAGVIASNQKSKFSFKLNEWNGSTTSNL